jgi:hypothetical protein
MEEDSKIRLVPNVEEFSFKKHLYYIKPLIGRVQLLRGLYHYLKQIQHNKYIFNREFNIESIKTKEEFTPQLYYTYRFDFVPFKTLSIRIELELDLFTGKHVNIRVVREDKGDNSVKETDYLSYLLFDRGDLANSSPDKFGDVINNIHKHTIECAVESNSPKSALRVIEKFIPEEAFDQDPELMNLYKSLTSVDKYNL